MTVYARYDGPRVKDHITPGKLYEVLDEIGPTGFYFRSDKGGREYGLWQDCAHLDGGNWTRVEIPDYPEHHVRFGPDWAAYGDGPRNTWYVVPDYRPNGDPATSATVVDRAGQQVAHFERIADAETAVEAVNGREA